MRILIVEDDPGVSAFLEEALRKTGHDASSFGHAGLALGAIARGKFELLICDLMLPNVPGIDAIRMARSQFPYLPIIAISAAPEEEWRDKCFEVGASCFISKPIRLDRLLSEIKFVEQAQVHLSVGIVDPDPRHRERVTHELTSLGCDVHDFEELEELLADPSPPDGISVFLFDAELESILDAITWASCQEVPAVVFGAEDPGFDEEKMLRLGASFCLSKPVDTEALMIQARFFVSPVPQS